MITLHPMTDAEYQVFLNLSYESYADDLTLANPLVSRESAIKEAQSELSELLPQGLHTKNHYLFAIRNDQGEQVGYLWYDLLNPSRAFIDDLLIFPAHRRQGVAFQALKLMEEQLTATHIRLHVFESNHAARRLYEKSGYEYLQLERSQPGSLYMFKRIR